MGKWWVERKNHNFKNCKYSVNKAILKNKNKNCSFLMN